MYQLFRQGRTCAKTLAILSIVWLWLPLVSEAQQTNPASEFLKMLGMPAGMGQIWEGRITFTRHDSKEKDIDNSRPGLTDLTIDRHAVDANVTIMFCVQPGGSGMLRIWGVQKTWQENWEKGHQVKHDETMCEKDDGTGKKKMEAVSPGNEQTTKEYGRTELCDDKEIPEDKYTLGPEGVKVAMVPMNGGYHIMAGVEQFLNYTQDTESLETQVCSGRQKTSKIMARTVPFSQKPSSSESGGEDSKVYLIETHPIASGSFVFAKHVVIADDQEEIEGSETLVDVKAEKPGDWNRKTVVSWRIRMKNYCDDVFDALYTDLALAEAFNDPNIRQQATSIENYEKSVVAKAGQTYQSNNPDPDRFTGIKMSLNPESCQVEGIEEAKKSLQERCLPEVIFDAVYAHEKRHARQCKMDADMALRTIDKLGNYETDAYMAGIRVYIEWLQVNCQKDDHRLAVAKDRLDALSATRTK
ncbi:MAG: hypothetical protein JW902_06055 [Syntrophaceae bacterium]|nr:hypothetical protein [Syntrophaceae bacterium]